MSGTKVRSREKRTQNEQIADLHGIWRKYTVVELDNTFGGGVSKTFDSGGANELTTRVRAFNNDSGLVHDKLGGFAALQKTAGVIATVASTNATGYDSAAAADQANILAPDTKRAASIRRITFDLAMALKTSNASYAASGKLVITVKAINTAGVKRTLGTVTTPAVATSSSSYVYARMKGLIEFPDFAGVNEDEQLLINVTPQATIADAQATATVQVPNAIASPSWVSNSSNYQAHAEGFWNTFAVEYDG